MAKATAVHAAGVILLVVIALGVYGFMHDAFAGFHFSTSATTWGGWALGVVLLGLVHVLAEGGFDWATSADRTTDPLGQRVGRLFLGFATVAVILALAAFMYSLFI